MSELGLTSRGPLGRLPTGGPEAAPAKIEGLPAPCWGGSFPGLSGPLQGRRGASVTTPPAQQGADNASPQQEVPGPNPCPPSHPPPVNLTLFGKVFADLMEFKCGLPGSRPR